MKQRRLTKPPSPRVKPDSQRINELLPLNTYIQTPDDETLHFVNREQAMLRLLDVHGEHFWRRSEGMGSGDYVQYPLIDNLRGMGKTTFCRKYLALVERYVSQKRSQYRGNEDQIMDAIAADLQGSPPPSISPELKSVAEVDKSPDSLFGPKRARVEAIEGPQRYENLSNMLGELQKARTLYFEFRNASLAGKSWETNFLEHVKEALLSQWGVRVPAAVDWRKCSKYYIQKPVFFVFDEIGNAFNDPSLTTELKRSQFLIFVESICEPISGGDGMFYVLSGVAEFLRHLGVCPEDDFHESLGEFVRIHLNPIAECDIKRILENTFKDGARLVDSVEFDSRNIDNLVEELYATTGGHPRTLAARLLRDEYPRQIEDSFMTADIREALDWFPKGIQTLFDMRNRNDVNLAKRTDERYEQSVSFQYLAGRLHADYGMNSCHTQLRFPPPVERLLAWRFLPFLEYLDVYSSVVGKVPINSQRVFQEVLTKWFQSVFRRNLRSVKNILGDFCPQNSFLREKTLVIDPIKCVNGPKILPEPRGSSSEKTISLEDFGSLMRRRLESDDNNIYFPDPGSASPAFFVTPDCGSIPTRDYVIGVQTILLETLTAKDCIEEATKFYENLKHLRENGRALYGVLLIFTVSSDTQADFPDLHRCKAIVWGNEEISRRSWEDLEIIIINLGTKFLRKAFFNLAVAEGSQAKAHLAIENIIDTFEANRV